MNISRQNSQAVELFVKETKKFVKRYVKKAPFDKTRQGFVTAVLGNNKYSVRIGGAVYTVPSCTSDTYKVNDNVLVLYVQNNIRRKYIIGKAV